MHDADKAFFKITQKKNFIEVKAEFPWTIRKALMKSFPELLLSKEQEGFDIAFFMHIEQNFKIIGSNGALNLRSVEKGLADGHSHQNNYTFIFGGSAFSTITNTVMFNLSNSHENHHQLVIDGELQEYVTDLSTPQFLLSKILIKVNAINNTSEAHRKLEDLHSNDERTDGDHTHYYYVPLVIILLLVVYYIRRIK